MKINSDMKNIIKFSFSSFSSFVLDYILFSVLIFILPSTPAMIITANISARIISAVYNYCINCRFVFKERKKIRSAVHYFLLALFILTMNNILMECFTQLIHISPYLSKLITECTLFIISWLIQRNIIFKKNNGETIE